MTKRDECRYCSSTYQVVLMLLLTVRSLSGAIQSATPSPLTSDPRWAVNPPTPSMTYQGALPAGATLSRPLGLSAMPSVRVTWKRTSSPAAKCRPSPVVFDVVITAVSVGA